MRNYEEFKGVIDAFERLADSIEINLSDHDYVNVEYEEIDILVRALRSEMMKFVYQGFPNSSKYKPVKTTSINEQK